MSDPATAARRPDLLDAPRQPRSPLVAGVEQRTRQPSDPPLVGMDAVIDPRSYTEPDTRDIAALGYAYALRGAVRCSGIRAPPWVL